MVGPRLTLHVSPQVEVGFTRRYRVFQLSGGADRRPALSVPAGGANHRYRKTASAVDHVGAVLVSNPSAPLCRTFKPEVCGRLPGLLVQVAGPAVLGVQLGGRRPDCQEVPETHRRLHEQKPVQDHSLQRLQGNK